MWFECEQDVCGQQHCVMRHRTAVRETLSLIVITVIILILSLNSCKSSLRTADVFPVVASLPLAGEKRRPEIHLLFSGYCKSGQTKLALTTCGPVSLFC